MYKLRKWGDIYRKATKVAVRLGPANWQSDFAMDSLEWWGQKMSTLVNHPVYTEPEDLGLLA